MNYYAIRLEQYEGFEEYLERIKLMIDDIYGKFTYKLNHEWLECLNDKVKNRHIMISFY